MNRGFTLIELLIVVAIIAILAAIAVPNFLEAQTRSKVSRCKTDQRSIATALESYAADHNKYPPIAAPNSPLARTGPGNMLGPSVWYSDDPAFEFCTSSRFIWLTTPVAYISSVFKDPFLNGSLRRAYGPDGEVTPSEIYDAYEYLEGKSVSPGGLFDAPIGASICSGAAWSMSGCGPDLRQCYGGVFENGNLTARWNGCDYDPTNGTISQGDIVRIASAPGQLYDLQPTYNRVTNVWKLP